MTRNILQNAVNAKKRAMLLSEEEKNSALLKMADMLIKKTDEILEANSEDMKKASGRLSDSMLDRLLLTRERIESMADGIRKVSKLPDPVGKILEKNVRPNGLVIEKVSVPIGVVAIIYESRPNVTSDAAALALKSSNVCVLRCGKDAAKSAEAIVSALRSGLKNAGVDENMINLVTDTSRESAYELMQATGYIDLLIPRGGAGLINACINNARVPCIQTGTGICHIYVDDSADLKKALDIVENAKTSRPSVCNAAEVLLVSEKAADKFLPMLKDRLVTSRENKGLNKVELRCDERAYHVIGCTKAGPDDFDTEFLDYVLAVKVVKDVRSAIEHILTHSTGHSECIVTENEQNAELFSSQTDSAAVYVNASTRFTDGGEFGLGCEMGISTQKLHARGPMGLKELTTYKYVIKGNGQIR